MKSLSLAVLTLLVTTMTVSLSADEGMWLFNNPPRKLLKEKYGFEPTPSLARARAEGVRALQQRRLRLVRLGRRPGHDQPPRRRRRPAEAQHRRSKDYLKDGFHAKTPAEELKCADLELNVLHEHRGRDRAGQRGGQAGHDAGRGAAGPPGGDGRDREGGARQDRPAQRRGHALPGRAVPPLPLQEVHRRPARLRPGAGDRLLRRRPGQLRVSRATTSTSASSASTRTTSRPRSSTT